MNNEDNDGPLDRRHHHHEPQPTQLVDLFRQSLGSGEAFLWRQRLLQERLMKNVTDLHERALLHVRALIESGDDQFKQAEVAADLGIGLSPFRDALRRAKGIGLLVSVPQYRPGPDGRMRRTVNLYRLSMPPGTPEPRPDLRRQSPPVSNPAKPRQERGINRFPTCSLHGNAQGRILPTPAMSLAASEARAQRAWEARHRGA